MNQDKLNRLIQEASQLNKIEKLIIIKFLVDDKNKDSLTDKEKQFIEESEKHISELRGIRKQLREVIKKFE
ncbi:MAG: hypothetical protein HYY52_05470 [Candidatus Melainabacteria bacterium]|nr:hypothetical protein [Candidatus Melainabacteria bacterium]